MRCSKGTEFIILAIILTTILLLGAGGSHIPSQLPQTVARPSLHYIDANTAYLPIPADVYKKTIDNAYDRQAVSFVPGKSPNRVINCPRKVHYFRASNVTHIGFQWHWNVNVHDSAQVHHVVNVTDSPHNVTESLTSWPPDLVQSALRTSVPNPPPLSASMGDSVSANELVDLLDEAYALEQVVRMGEEALR